MPRSGRIVRRSFETGKRLPRLTFSVGAALIVWASVGAPSRLAQTDQFEQSVRPFLSRTCYMCHNPELKSGGLNLKAFQTIASVIENRETFERVLKKLKAGEMPPKGMPRPKAADLQNVIAWIGGELERADRLAKPDPGRVTARRLNRAEYNNTVRDLLGVDLRPADDFPQDDSGYGFDNIGDVLSLSPVLMERYLAAAEQVARAAVFGPEQVQPTMARRRSLGRKLEPSLTPPSDYDLTGLTLPNALHITYRFPQDGDYIIRAFLSGSRPIGSEPFQMALWIDGGEARTIEFDPIKTAAFDDVEKQELGGKAQEFRVRVRAGIHWIAVSIPRLYEGLPARYGGPNPSRRPPPPPPKFKPPPDLPAAKIEQFRKRFEAQVAAAEKAPVNEARITSFEIGGPYNQPKGPSAESLRKLYSCGHLHGHHRADCARKIVAVLARRAFRRPVTQAEVDRLAGLVSLARARGDSFDEGLCLSIQAMLISPNFLFRIEKDPPSGGKDMHAVSEYELASRLSYFLWSSMPDEELMSLADRRMLRRPGVLGAQVRRMLEDSKARALAENFAGQWLELRKLESARPDRKRFPDFDEYLRMSMHRETELFFETIQREDLSVLELIDADFSFLNGRLAQFYGVPGVTGPEFRRVKLGSETHRGGVITQASVLTVSSYATRTSPVLRGKWILEKILNAPPPPPLPDVPNLDESKIGSEASLRQQLEAHRKNTICASCHQRMDPLGFGLENFDAVGEWRTQDGKFPIDASGVLPDGRTFNGPEELKAILKADREAFVECLAVKLLTYALGRGLESYDRPAVKRIAAEVAAHDYRFSSLVLAICDSLPFQMRRGERAT